MYSPAMSKIEYIFFEYFKAYRTVFSIEDLLNYIFQ